MFRRYTRPCFWYTISSALSSDFLNTSLMRLALPVIREPIACQLSPGVAVLET